jgi:phosphoribosylformylglycinamidine synthase
LRRVPNDEPGMSPLEIWCNESQERYVLAVPADRLWRRSRNSAPASAAHLPSWAKPRRSGVSSGRPAFPEPPIDLPLEVLLGKPPRMHRSEHSQVRPLAPLQLADLSLREAVRRVLSHPTVADKTFLISIGDRSVTGLICRDQMVGPWQVPVADCGVTAAATTSPPARRWPWASGRPWPSTMPPPRRDSRSAKR